MDRYLTIILLAITVVLSGCALFGGTDNLDLEHAEGLKTTAPSTWASLKKNASDEAYKTPSGAIVTLISSCNRRHSTPLSALTRQLLIGARKIHYKRPPETKLIAQSEGLYSSVDGLYQNSKMHLEIFVLSRGGCVFDFTMVGPRAFEDSDLVAFNQYLESFVYDIR